MLRMRSLCRVYVRVLWGRGATDVIAGLTNVANSMAIRFVAVGVGTLVAYKPAGGFESVLAAVVMRSVKRMSLAGDTVLRVSAPGSVPAGAYGRSLVPGVRPIVGCCVFGFDPIILALHGRLLSLFQR